VRPTRGVLLALAAAGVLHLLARTTGVGWLALGATAALALPAAALLLAPRLSAVEVRPAPLRTRVGGPTVDRWTVRNTGSRASAPLQVRDVTPGLAPLVVAVPALPPGGQVEAVPERTATARGWTAARVMELTSDAPLGLLRRSARPDVPAEVLVAPAAVRAGRDAAGAGAGTGRPSGRAGAGSEVLGLRPWRAGDGRTAVSARASARHGRPVVLERERDSGPRLVVACGGPGSGPEWEAAVARSCALAEAAVRDGAPLLLLAAGLPPVDRPDRDAVLAWHARLDAARPWDARCAALASRAVGPAGTVRVVGSAPPGLRAVPV
jgi:uncharacterized protein (DUF58 family)